MTICAMKWDFPPNTSMKEQADLQVQRILSNLTISTWVRSVGCIQDCRARPIKSEDVKVGMPISVAWHESIRVMRRVER